MNTTNRTYLQNLCRVCLNPEYFVPGGKDDGGARLQNNSLLCPTLCKLFYCFTTLDVRQEIEDFPKHLCLICLSKLRDYEDFREEALRSTSRLHDMLNDKEKVNIVNDTYEVQMEIVSANVTTIKSEKTYAEYDEDVKREAVFKDETDEKLEHAYCNRDDDENSHIDDNTLLLPELANMPINIKTEPNFEATDTHFTLPFYGKLDETHENELHETNNSEDDCIEEELLLLNGAANNSSQSIESVNENIPKQEILKKEKRECCDKRPPLLHCPKCNKQFRNKIYLDAHVLGKHFGKERPFQCSNCSITFKIYNDLNLHMLTNHTDEIKEVVPRNRRIEPSGGYNCQICGHSYVSSRALTEHLKRHNKIKDHVCNECGVTKVTRNELLIHMRVHMPNLEKFQCPQCPQEFNFKNAISRHIKVVHEGLKRFPCTFCPRRFATRNSQTSHERLHTGERPFKCSMCQKGFAQKESLVSHMKNHDKNLRKHVCSYCSQRFITLKNLKDHEKRHLGDKPHICTVCNKGYYNAEDLEKHRTCHENIGSEVELHPKDRVSQISY